MATAVKNSRIKIKKSAPEKVGEVINEETEVEADITPSKVRKVPEIDDIEPAVVIEEKVEEDPLLAAEEDEESEEISLDGEELNPFGDRWEE